MFIGFANYYRRFIERFSRIAAPLNRLTERGPSIAYSGYKQRKEESRKIYIPPNAIKSFELLKEAFCAAPILKHFNLERPIRVETNASRYAVLGILYQRHEFKSKIQ